MYHKTIENLGHTSSLIDSINEINKLLIKLERLVIENLEFYFSPVTRKKLQRLIMLYHCGKFSQEEQLQIISAFRKLAENDVGQMLLTRILIAIKNIQNYEVCPRLTILRNDFFGASYIDKKNGSRLD